MSNSNKSLETSLLNSSSSTVNLSLMIKTCDMTLQKKEKEKEETQDFSVVN